MGLPKRSPGGRGGHRPSASAPSGGEQSPPARDPAKGVGSPFGELAAGAGGGAADRGRHEHLPRCGEGGDAGGDVDGQAAEVVADELTLPRVQAGAHLEVELFDGGTNRAGAADRRAGEGEGGEEAVADRLDLTPAETLELRPHD